MRVQVILGVANLLATTALAQEVSVGQRITIDSEWHQQNGGAYSPLVVDCSAASGMCLRDTRMEPADTPIEVVDGGMRIAYSSWNLAYVLLPNGVGQTTDLNGSVIGEITWSQ